jgi:hypothetical protein
MANMKLITGGATAAALTMAGVISVVTLPNPNLTSEAVEYQQKCALAQAYHTLYLPVVAKSFGYDMQFAIGEAERPSWVAKIYANKGIGSSDSLHIRKLAQDKHLFIDGKYTSKTSDHTLAGVFWESRELREKFKVNTRWGGRFKRQDGNHYECVPE